MSIYYGTIAWSVILLPLLGALYQVVLGKAVYHKWGKRPVDTISVGVVGLSFILILVLFFYILSLEPGSKFIIAKFFNWFFIENRPVEITLLINPLSISMALMVCGVGFLIHLYSIGYMDKDKGYSRYFAYMNLFMFSMLVLVFSNNLVLFFLGWEGVGICSYLLIGFWFSDLDKAKAGMKAFIVNRIGDFGFLIGVLLLFWAYDQNSILPFDITSLKGSLEPLLNQSFAGFNLATWVTLCFFVGATGKSAQIPLYVWLPDAMAGPTPVSALIHAATMVTAGVYMIARLSFLFIHAPLTLEIIAIIGTLTAFFAATIGLCQKDIKKVLAYSTISQLGYMFMAMGVGAFTAGFFHLLSHAFFKACLFLGAGSVIHSMGGEQDMGNMGGLRKKMPLTFLTFLISALAISGFPFFSGFFSKDEILFSSFASPIGNVLFWVVGAITAFLTAFYMFRLVFLTFFGECRACKEIEEHLHESPRVMTFPLLVLAFLAIVGGALNLPEFLWIPKILDRFLLSSVFQFPGFEESLHAKHALEMPLMAVSTMLGLFGILLAYVFYLRMPSVPLALSKVVCPLYGLLWNKYYVDEIYQTVAVKPVLVTSFLAAQVDNTLIDGAVNATAYTIKKASNATGEIDLRVVDGIANGIAYITMESGSKISKLQTGVLQNYLSYAVAGAIVMFFIFLFL